MAPLSGRSATLRTLSRQYQNPYSSRSASLTDTTTPQYRLNGKFVNRRLPASGFAASGVRDRFP
jgi:hypothetical protein